MRALEFKTRVKNNQILIPAGIQSELKTNRDIRVIVLIDDHSNDNELAFQEVATAEFLKGYSESDAVYDNY